MESVGRREERKDVRGRRVGGRSGCWEGRRGRRGVVVDGGWRAVVKGAQLFEGDGRHEATERASRCAGVVRRAIETAGILIVELAQKGL